MNVLHEAGFSDGHWEQLGQQLIEYGILATFRANRRGDSSLCMEISSVKLLVDTLKTGFHAWSKIFTDVYVLDGAPTSGHITPLASTISSRNWWQ